jgi:hypothetical protein
MAAPDRSGSMQSSFAEPQLIAAVVYHGEGYELWADKCPFRGTISGYRIVDDAGELRWAFVPEHRHLAYEVLTDIFRRKQEAKKEEAA